jgi:3-(3-hydroxy-phenyl)propionate hydroxylase
LLGQGFAVIGMGVNPKEALSAKAMSLLESMGTRYVAMYGMGERPQGSVSRSFPMGIQIAEDLNGTLVQWLHKHHAATGDIVLVRPDRFVFAVLPANNSEQAMRALKQQLHPTPTSTKVSV